jgi:protein-ribulosamine 3-kinase
VLEWLKLRPLTEESASHFGRLLAALHRHIAPQFGWYRNNTIGLTPQINGLMSNWFEFWKERRLRFQLEIAARNGYTGRLQDLGAQLIECCGVLFSGYSPEPSLLHGDLWHGNAASSMSGEPVTFDPASYYGDREADLAMTSLFGGFPNTFMASYEATWPLNDGYAIRKDFYNVYHLINHLNLFGSGYLTQTEMTMQRVLAQITT